MKRLLIVPVLFAALGLSACGLRGDLERPDPLWGEPKEEVQEQPDAEKIAELRPRTEPVDKSYRDPNTGEIVWVQNENGGDKPLAAPVKPLEESTGLPPIEE